MCATTVLIDAWRIEHVWRLQDLNRLLTETTAAKPPSKLCLYPKSPVSVGSL